jgi:hypothetical protein
VRLATALLVLLLGGAATPATSQDASTGGEVAEYELKAGFLYNFAKYVAWPADAFASPDAPIRIGVVGADPFGSDLERTLRDKTVNARGFEVLRYGNAEDVGSVHILFVPHSERSRLQGILERVKRRPVLTVGEDDAFSRRGGVVAILIERRQPRLQINLRAAAQQGLQIATKLLRIATIVGEAE